MVPLFFEPGEKYVAVSITGFACELLCDYCRGRWLRGMVPASTPDTLRRVLDAFARRGVKGVLISGGFNRSGYLPIEPFIPVLKEFKKNHREVILSLHSGLMPLELLEELSEIVDVLDFEIPVSRAQLVQMHLNHSIREYLLLAKRAEALGFYVVPHVLLGLPGSSVYEETANARLVACTLKPQILVLLYSIESLQSPRCILERLRTTILAVRECVRGVSLGCMRPRSIKHREYILYRLVDRVATPSPLIRKYFNAPLLPYCCSVPSTRLAASICSNSASIPS